MKHNAQQMKGERMKACRKGCIRCRCRTRHPHKQGVTWYYLISNISNKPKQKMVRGKTVSALLGRGHTEQRVHCYAKFMLGLCARLQGPCAVAG